MIDPLNADHRARLSKSMDFWNREMDLYRKARRETILNYVGIQQLATSFGIDVNTGDKRILGNLIQLSGLAHTIQLAYNDPRYLVVANQPAGEAVSMRLETWLDRYAPMIGLGDVARAIALDSFFGFGIVKVDVGFLPPGVQKLTGQQTGPMCWRVSQDCFGYDGNATNWDEVSFVWDTVMVPLDEARDYEPFLDFNPEDTVNLTEFRGDQQNDHSELHNRGDRSNSAQAMVRLVHVYLPHSGQIVVWACNSSTFSEVSGMPLMVRQWNGHHTGPYAVLTHLDIPDNLLPVSQAESTKGLHFLFNELADRTAHQAVEAKVNPVYEMGAQQDIQRWENAQDRESIPVSNIARLGIMEKPGPTQSQTAYMGTVLQMFKMFANNVDDTLGLGATAPTARQSELIRSATNARTGEGRRRMNRVMELVGRKLSHLLLNDQTMSFPMRRPVPRSGLTMDVSWLPPQQLPRNPDADDYLISVVPESMDFRSPYDRLESLKQASAEIIQAAQAAMSGIPLDMAKFVEIQAKYRDLPELLDLWLGLVPEHAEAKAAAQNGPRIRPEGTGEYTRTSVSQQSDQGAMMQNMTQFSDSPGAGAQPRVA